jgi:hypothetical protein
MRLVSTDPNEPGIFAVGQLAVGIFALGQLSLGVVAVGQLARGVFAFGQLAVGVVAIGQAPSKSSCIRRGVRGTSRTGARLRASWGLLRRASRSLFGRWRSLSRSRLFR